jgi:myosin heavy subunit
VTRSLSRTAPPWQTTPPGILQLLDEEARFPKGSDDSFLAKVTTNHKKNAHFETPRLRGRSPSFIVRHYAGDVRYLPLLAGLP